MPDVMFVGLDVHKATISVAVAQGAPGDGDRSTTETVQFPGVHCWPKRA